MSEPENSLGQRWSATLSERERARLDAAFALDPDLEQDLHAMLDGLAAQRREPFVRRFAANLAHAQSPQEALLLALAGMRGKEFTNEGGDVTRLGDRPPGQSEA